MFIRLFLTSVFSVALFAMVFSSCASGLAQTPDEQEQLDAARKSKKKDETRLYMRAKLSCAQDVMEGLVTENFNLIHEGAVKMKKISEAAHWPTTVDEVYQHHSVAFRLQCDKLAEQAEAQDLRAAHYTYLHMSTTCIDCHNYVRGKFTVERNSAGGPVQLIPTQWDGPLKKKGQPVPQPDDYDKNDG